jgi:hypothetical protein
LVLSNLPPSRTQRRLALIAALRRFRVERRGEEIGFDYGVALRPNSWNLMEISERK